MIRPSPDKFATERLQRFDRSWTRKRLPNGMTAIHVPMPEDDRFYLGVMIKTGTRLESAAHAGISHFLEHMMFRGSGRYPDFTQLAEAFEWLGGDWNAATSHEHTEYTYTGIRHTAPEIVSLFADFLEKPVLADIEIERNVILRELDGETNEHGYSTDGDHHIAGLVYPGSSMALPILGTRESLAEIDVPKLRAWREQWYTPANMVVCAVGGDASMMQLVEQSFGSHRAERAGAAVTGFPPYSTFKGPAVKWVEHSDNEYEIRLAFLCGSEWSADAALYEMIARILSDGFCSRLNKRLREELGLVYDIGCDAHLTLESGTISIGAACAKDHLDEFLRELFTLLKGFVATGPTEDELRRAALRGVVDLELSPLNAEYVATRLSWQAICGRQRSFLEDRDRLVKIKAEDVARALREVFRPERTALVALGPSGKDIEKRLRKAITL
jgi:predicted Zn-dependent peptidase